jgi:hypothetical protein
MTDEDATRAWEDDIVRGLRSLAADDVPSLEVIVLDAVVDWLFSAVNPGDGYSEEHAGQLISALFTALDSARGFQPQQAPVATDEIAAARARIVAGAHELAAEGPSGVSLTVSRLMPAVIAELQNHAGERGKQAHGVFVYLLYAIAIGTRVEQEPALMNGLVATFSGWNAVLREGYVVPWRRRPA